MTMIGFFDCPPVALARWQVRVLQRWADEPEEGTATMAKIERNGTCSVCDGKVRYYPRPFSTEPGSWSHLDRADWIDNPHDPVPTQASLQAAGLAS